MIRSNWIVLPVFNCLKLTQDCVRSLRDQDIPVRLFMIDGGSTDGTLEYLRSIHYATDRLVTLPKTHGVSRSWNIALSHLFKGYGAEYALVVNNDTRLRSDAYRRLLSDGGGFVTCVGSSDGAAFPGETPKMTRRPHPDFSCFLLRASVWQRVGEFDESLVNYCSDGDYHLRMQKAGIEAYCLDVPFYHEASGTVKNVSLADRERILTQAAVDRARFETKWGCPMGSRDYYRIFGEGGCITSV